MKDSLRTGDVHVPFLDFAFQPRELHLEEDDRILVLAPHPDDEVLGAGGIIMEAAERSIPVHITFLTLGDFNEWSFAVYRRRPDLTPAQVRASALQRAQEALAAAAVMGVPADVITFLGYPDAGTLAVWYEHWADRPPYRARLTRATQVPYDLALRPGAEYKGEEFLKDLETVLIEFRPTKVFVSHPADHHPDHRALYLYLTVVLWDLQGEVEPDVYPYLVHYAGWPQPKSYAPGAPLLPPAELEDTVDWLEWPLSQTMVERKLEALRAHKTQWGASSRFLRRFVRRNELFGDFSIVDPLGAFPADFDSEEANVPAPVSDLLTDAEEALFVEAEQAEDAAQLYEQGADYVVISTHLTAEKVSAYLAEYFEDREQFLGEMQPDLERIEQRTPRWDESTSRAGSGGETDG
jgi:LmbE family N-acetylglucosaminyl deacetylase